jgi:methionyl-tRNA formyltransferase
MKIAYFGAVRFSQHCLHVVLQAGGNVVGVYSPSRRGTGPIADGGDLAGIARANQIPFRKFSRTDEPGLLDEVRKQKPDIIFVFGLSKLISPSLLALPPLGAIGSHPALLPEHRGRHPLIWALIENLSESGLTFFYLTPGIDDGDILWQKKFSISKEDNAGTLYSTIERIASEAIPQFLPQLENGTAPRLSQDGARATYWRKRTISDGEVQWDSPGISIYNLVRALTRPYPGATTSGIAKSMVLWRCALPTLSDGDGAVPGQILSVNEKSFCVRTGDGVINVIDWQLLSGKNIKVGERLGGAHS